MRAARAGELGASRPEQSLISKGWFFPSCKVKGDPRVSRLGGSCKAKSCYVKQEEASSRRALPKRSLCIPIHTLKERYGFAELGISDRAASTGLRQPLVLSGDINTNTNTNTSTNNNNNNKSNDIIMIILAHFGVFPKATLGCSPKPLWVVFSFRLKVLKAWFPKATLGCFPKLLAPKPAHTTPLLRRASVNPDS